MKVNNFISLLFMYDIMHNSDINSNLDLSVFMLNDSKLLESAEHFVFYNNLQSICQSITYKPSDVENKEIVNINLNNIPTSITEIVFALSANDISDYRHVTKQNLASFKNTKLSIFDDQNHQKNEFEFDFSKQDKYNMCRFAKLKRMENEWNFEIITNEFESCSFEFFIEKFYSVTFTDPYVFTNGYVDEDLD